MNTYTARVFHKATDGENQQRQTEERYRNKNQGYWRIKQGSDGNHTKIGRPQVTDIDNNIVAPFIHSGTKTNDLSIIFKRKNQSIIYYFTRYINEHVVECFIIIKVSFDYTE